MPRLYLAFLLDLFQPCDQKQDLITEIAAECCGPLAELFNFYRSARFTVSLANSLAQWLIDHGETDVIEQVSEAIGSGHAELVHTAAYHCILPLYSSADAES